MQLEPDLQPVAFTSVLDILISYLDLASDRNKIATDKNELIKWIINVRDNSGKEK